MSKPNACPQCGGPPKEEVELGSGSSATIWRRCRDCGWDWERFKAEEEPGGEL